MPDKATEEYGIVIAKKAERLVTALYLVTDLIDNNEPIKNKLRGSAVTLLSSMNALAQHDIKDKMSLYTSSLMSVTEIISMLHVALTAGMISDMNGTLLTNGFRVLQMILEKRQPSLTSEMLYVDREELLYDNTPIHSGITSTSYDAITPRTLSHSTPHSKGDNEPSRKNLFKGQYETNTKRQVEPTLIMPVSVAPVRPLGSKDGMGLASSFQTRKQSRRDQILALFVKGVDVSIKDIASRIKGCSEKTIQRELNALLYDNIIERIGEKRWSRYVLR